MHMSYNITCSRFWPSNFNFNLVEICAERREARKEGELRRTPVRRRDPDQRFAPCGAKICQI